MRAPPAQSRGAQHGSAPRALCEAPRSPAPALPLGSGAGPFREERTHTPGAVRRRAHHTHSAGCRRAAHGSAPPHGHREWWRWVHRSEDAVIPAGGGRVVWWRGGTGRALQAEQNGPPHPPAPRRRQQLRECAPLAAAVRAPQRGRRTPKRHRVQQIGHARKGCSFLRATDTRRRPMSRPRACAPSRRCGPIPHPRARWHPGRGGAGAYRRPGHDCDGQCGAFCCVPTFHCTGLTPRPKVELSRHCVVRVDESERQPGKSDRTRYAHVVVEADTSVFVMLAVALKGRRALSKVLCATPPELSSLSGLTCSYRMPTERLSSFSSTFPAHSNRHGGRSRHRRSLRADRLGPW